MEYKSSLPKSLRNKRTKQICIRIILFLLLLALSLFTIQLFSRSFSESNKAVAITLTVIFLIFPFAVTGVPFKLIDFTWCGTITAINVKEGRASHAAGGRGGIHRVNNLVLTVVTESNRKIKYTALSLAIKDIYSAPYVQENGKIEYQEERFSVGDKVCKYYGFKYLFVLRQNDTDPKHCIVCGTVNLADRHRCLGCGSDLID